MISRHLLFETFYFLFALFLCPTIQQFIILLFLWVLKIIVQYSTIGISPFSLSEFLTSMDVNKF